MSIAAIPRCRPSRRSLGRCEVMMAGVPNRRIDSILADGGNPAGSVIAETGPGGKPWMFPVRNDGTICRRDATDHDHLPAEGKADHTRSDHACSSSVFDATNKRRSLDPPNAGKRRKIRFHPAKHVGTRVRAEPFCLQITPKSGRQPAEAGLPACVFPVAGDCLGIEFGREFGVADPGRFEGVQVGLVTGACSSRRILRRRGNRPIG